MRRRALVLILFAAALTPSMAEADCTPHGWVVVGPGGPYYNHIANGAPAIDDCWNSDAFRERFVTDNACDFFPNAYQFGYGGSIYQIVTVPSGMTQTNWEFDYKLDYNDPNNDPYWNRISVTIRDITTNTILASDSYAGPAVFCSSRRLPFKGNLAGHQILVSFNGSTAYSNSIVKVRRMELWQW